MAHDNHPDRLQTLNIWVRSSWQVGIHLDSLPDQALYVPVNRWSPGTEWRLKTRRDIHNHEASDDGPWIPSVHNVVQGVQIALPVSTSLAMLRHN